MSDMTLRQMTLFSVTLLSLVPYTISLTALELSANKTYLDDTGRYQGVVVAINLIIASNDEEPYLQSVKVCSNLRFLLYFGVLIS